MPKANSSDLVNDLLDRTQRLELQKKALEAQLDAANNNNGPNSSTINSVVVSGKRTAEDNCECVSCPYKQEVILCNKQMLLLLNMMTSMKKKEMGLANGDVMDLDQESVPESDSTRLLSFSELKTNGIKTPKSSGKNDSQDENNKQNMLQKWLCNGQSPSSAAAAAGGSSSQRTSTGSQQGNNDAAHSSSKKKDKPPETPVRRTSPRKKQKKQVIESDVDSVEELYFGDDDKKDKKNQSTSSTRRAEFVCDEASFDTNASRKTRDKSKSPEETNGSRTRKSTDKRKRHSWSDSSSNLDSDSSSDDKKRPVVSRRGRGRGGGGSATSNRGRRGRPLTGRSTSTYASLGIGNTEKKPDDISSSDEEHYEDTGETAEDGKKKFQCKLPGCSHIACGYDAIRFHIRSHRAAPFKCPHCLYTATTIPSIRRHAGQRHTDRRLFVCSFCAKKDKKFEEDFDFPFRDHLMKHLNKRADKLPADAEKPKQEEKIKLIDDYIDKLFKNPHYKDPNRKKDKNGEEKK